MEVRKTDEYARWFEKLRDRKARARILVRVRRLSLGNPGDVASVGEGVSELRIDYGPGYRVYFKQQSKTVFVLLIGGDKRTQKRDIEVAKQLARNLEDWEMAKKTKTRAWDAAEHLATEEDMAAYLEAALEDGDPAVVTAALGDIARAKGMTEIARQTGLGRESLYKALSPEGNPELATVLKVVKSLGLKLHATAE
jgi:probable addiction module antidote protein/putative addiction module killer protein